MHEGDNSRMKNGGRDLRRVKSTPITYASTCVNRAKLAQYITLVLGLASISRTAEQPNIFMSRPHEISGIAGPPLRIVSSGLSTYTAHFAKTILFVAAFPLPKPVFPPPSFSPGFSHDFEP